MSYIKLSGSVLAASSSADGTYELGVSEFQMLDGLAAGTVQASKLVVVDANKDIASFRNLTAAGALTGGSLVVGGADMSEADLEKLDGITDGQGAANKALVLDANADVTSGLRNVTAAGSITAATSFIIGSADLNEADMEKLDDITNGTVAASKAVVVDANKDADGFRNIDGAGDLTMGTITMSGFSVDADGDLSAKSLVSTSTVSGAAGVSGASFAADGNAVLGGSVTAGSSFIIGSADLDETDLEKLDGITDGQGAANKALVLDANADVTSGLRNVTAAGSITAATSFIIGSADLNEADMEKLDDITNGTVAASKAVVVDANKDASGFRNVTAAGSVTAGTSFIIGSADLDETDLEKLDGITDGTAAANKALVLDASKDATGLRNLTMTGDMTAGTVTMTGFTVDGSGNAAAASAKVADISAGGIVFGGGGDGELAVHSGLGYASGSSTLAVTNVTSSGNHMIAGTLEVNSQSIHRGGLVSSSSFDVLGQADFAGDVNIGNATSDTLTVTARFDSDLVPSTDDARDLGASGLEWKDLYLDGRAFIDELRADSLGAALDANDQIITNINVDSGAIDGTTLGASTAAAAKVTSLSSSAGMHISAKSGPYPLFIADGAGEAIAEAWVTHSDRNLKTNIQAMDNNVALATVMNLQPATYEKVASGKSEIGFIAQDVAQVVPEICALDADGIGRGIDYSRMSTLLAGALKAQQEQIAQLKEIVAKLQK
jgi:hypothetical protein